MDTAPSTYFSPLPSRTLPRSTRMMTDSAQLRSSISRPRYHADFFTFAEHVSFERSTGSRCPVISSRREGNINKQTKLKNFFTLDRRSVIIALPMFMLFGHSAASARSGWRRDFLSNRKYRHRPHTQPDVGNCWPWIAGQGAHYGIASQYH